MWEKSILENGGTLESAPDCYKNQQMCDKAVDNYPLALKFVPNCYIIQKMWDKAVNTYHSTIQFVPDCYKTQEMCDKVVNKCFLAFVYIPDRYNPFMLVYCPDKYKTQKMCDEAVDDGIKIAALKFIPDWFAASKMIKNFLLLYIQMIIYSILMKILVMPYFLVMKWVFLI